MPRVRKLISLPLFGLLLVSVCASTGVEQGAQSIDAYSFAIALLRQFGGALIGGAFAFYGAVVAMRQQLADFGRRIEANEDGVKDAHSRISRHIEDHAAGRFK